eukprot:6907613-Pyramimonas_sp.AAC.1
MREYARRFPKGRSRLACNRNRLKAHSTPLLGQLALYVALRSALGDCSEVGDQLGPGGRQKPEWAPVRP